MVDPARKDFCKFVCRPLETFARSYEGFLVCTVVPISTADERPLDLLVAFFQGEPLARKLPATRDSVPLMALRSELNAK